VLPTAIRSRTIHEYGTRSRNDEHVVTFPPPTGRRGAPATRAMRSPSTRPWLCPNDRQFEYEHAHARVVPTTISSSTGNEHEDEYVSRRQAGRGRGRGRVRCTSTGGWFQRQAGRVRARRTSTLSRTRPRPVVRRDPNPADCLEIPEQRVGHLPATRTTATALRTTTRTRKRPCFVFVVGARERSDLKG
jgi:hypothetical protein